MSVFANRFQVFCYGATTRIIFEDCVHGKEGVIVANVVMPTGDAEQLIEIAGNIIKKSKEK